MTDPIETALSEGRRSLTESESKELLDGQGITVPAFEVARTVEGAVATAEEIGFPVAVKIDSPAIAHKTEWNGGAGLHLDCRSEEAVRRAADQIRAAADHTGIEYGILIERSLDPNEGIESIVGGVRDRTFGPTILFGLGGQFAEAIVDVSYRLAPVSPRVARTMTDEIQGATLLDGFRGMEPVDRESLSSTIVSLGDFLVETPAIAEIEINPLLATDEEAVALDALIVLGSE